MREPKPPRHICIIRPDIWSDDSFKGLSCRARLLWLGLASFLDCEGRAVFDAGHFAEAIFPGEDVAIDDLFGELRDQGMVEVYEAGGERYIQMGAFPRHQRVDKRRFSRLPDRDGLFSARPMGKKDLPEPGGAWPPRLLDPHGPPPIIQELKSDPFSGESWFLVGNMADTPTLGVLRAGERQDDWRVRYTDPETGDIDYARSIRDAQLALVAEGRRACADLVAAP